MPMFEYSCERCGHVTTVLQRSSRQPRPKCENCGDKDLRKIVSTFGVNCGSSGQSGGCATGTCPFAARG